MNVHEFVGPKAVTILIKTHLTRSANEANSLQLVKKNAALDVSRIRSRMKELVDGNEKRIDSVEVKSDEGIEVSGIPCITSNSPI